MRLSARCAAALAGLAGAAACATPPADAPPGLSAFAEMLAGRWESADAARAYVRVPAPGVEGYVFALQRYDAPDAETPSRVSLRRFREGADGAIANDFLYLVEPERWGDLTADLSALAALRESDARFNPGCTMTWRWAGARFEGATAPGDCVSTRIADEPVIVEAFGAVSASEFVHHDRLLTLEGEPFRADEGPEVFTRSARD